MVLSIILLAFTFNNLFVHTRRPYVQTMEVTAYCNCGKCCSYEPGKRKNVGQTASGTQTRIGTVAADPEVLPLGSVVYVPGYGWGRVEDKGGAIKGNKLDLWFTNHEAARKWGRKRIPVKIWKMAK